MTAKPIKNACAALAAFAAIQTLPAGAAPGDLDTTFTTAANGTVFSSALQPDGKILIGGGFTTVNGTPRVAIARLASDGSLDNSFSPSVTGGSFVEVYAISVQPDGKVIIGGNFTTVSGTTRNRIARLNEDGTLDTGFNPDANSNVSTIALQTDGKIVIGGAFTTVGGTTRNFIARLNANGALDTAFNSTDTSLDRFVKAPVSATVLQPDGKILICGEFHVVGNTARSGVARLNGDGTLDTMFGGSVDGGTVNDITLQPNGKVVGGGSFSTVNGTPRNNIVRFNADGTVDTTFDPDADETVISVALQADGKVILGGVFSNVGGIARNKIARVNSNGSLDTGFDPDANHDVHTTTLQADGKVLIGGSFSTVSGTTRLSIARLESAVTSARPDARLGLNATVATGNNRYNLTGAGQTLETTARRGGGIRNVFFGFQNDGTSTDAIRVRATVGNAKFAVGYFNGAGNVTAGVVSGGFSTGTLSPAGLKVLKARITARTPLAGKRHTLSVNATSVSDATVKDTALVKLRSN